MARRMGWLPCIMAGWLPRFIAAPMLSGVRRQIWRRVARGEQQPREVQTDVTLITPANLVEAALDSMTLLPRILHNLLESNAAQVRLQHEIIAAQRSMIQELSTPTIPISGKILVLPLIGTIDSVGAPDHGIDARCNQLGVNLSSLPTFSSLQAGLEHAWRRIA